MAGGAAAAGAPAGGAPGVTVAAPVAGVAAPGADVVRAAVSGLRVMSALPCAVFSFSSRWLSRAACPDVVGLGIDAGRAGFVTVVTEVAVGAGSEAPGIDVINFPSGSKTSTFCTRAKKAVLRKLPVDLGRPARRGRPRSVRARSDPTSAPWSRRMRPSPDARRSSDERYRREAQAAVEREHFNIRKVLAVRGARADGEMFAPRVGHRLAVRHAGLYRWRGRVLHLSNRAEEAVIRRGAGARGICQYAPGRSAESSSSMPSSSRSCAPAGVKRIDFDGKS